MDYAKVAQHNSAKSCWVILYGRVYDVTSFLPQHPGGSKIILQLAGRDATSEYDPVHPPGTLEESLSASCDLGEVDASTLPKPADDSKSKKDEAAEEGPPDLESLLNLDDIEAAAKPLLSRKAWAYYSSASDDGYSKRLNNAVFQSILFRPRIFVDCTRCDTTSKLLTHQKNPLSLEMPVFVAPAAMARLAHPDGEAAIARACASIGAAHVISNNASMTPEQIVADADPSQVFGWQLYVQTRREKSEAMLARIARLPQVKFIVLTLDAPVPGKREDDERTKHESGGPAARAAVQGDADGSTHKASGEGGGGAGLGKALFAGTAPDLTWATTLPWLAKHTDLPIILKGVQTHEDAWLAAQKAPQVQAIILSNHGGRALDCSPPAIHTLLEIHRYCPQVFNKVDVLIDGGMRRGTDVAKALCLGARAVGMGRAALYGLAVGGQAGVERVLTILKQELETAMRLLGCERVEQLGRRHINTRVTERDIYDGPANLDGPGLWSRSKL